MTLKEIEDKFASGGLVFFTDVELAVSEEITAIITRATAIRDALRERNVARVLELGMQKLHEDAAQ